MRTKKQLALRRHMTRIVAFRPPEILVHEKVGIVGPRKIVDRQKLSDPPAYTGLATRIPSMMVDY